MKMVNSILIFIVPIVIFLGFLEIKYMRNTYKYLYVFLLLVTTFLKFEGIYLILSFLIDSTLFVYIIYFKICRIIDEKNFKHTQ